MTTNGESGPWTPTDDIEVYIENERLDLLSHGVVRADGKRTLVIYVSHFGSSEVSAIKVGEET